MHHRVDALHQDKTFYFPDQKFPRCFVCYFLIHFSLFFLLLYVLIFVNFNNFMSEIRSYLTLRPLPLRSISLKPIEDKMPTHHFQCNCGMCSLYEFKRGQQQLKHQAMVASQKVKERINGSRRNLRVKKINGYYQWLLKHLLVPSNKICLRGLDITIPETIYYKDGEVLEFYLNKEIEELTIKRIPKQKINNTLIQKILGDRRKKYRDYIKINLGHKVEEKKKNLFGRKQIKKEVRDAVLIRENDGYEYIATQNQLLTLLSKRKQDPFWKKIFCIKNFINVQDYARNSLAIKYSRGQEKYQSLLGRAKILNQVYGKNILPGDPKYISDADEIKFEKELKTESKQIFAEYTLYKLVNFVEYFYDEKINKITAIFVFNEIDRIILNQVNKLEVQGLVKFEWTDQIYRKMCDEEERKFFFNKPIEVTEKVQKNSSVIEKQMSGEYEKMKEQYGLTVEDEDDREEVENDNFFKKMHPEFHHNISEILKDPHLTLQKFKKQFLGQKKQRTSIVKQFNSSMIKTIHELSPRWKRADPHQFIAKPKNFTASSFYHNPQNSSPTKSAQPRTSSLASRRLYATLDLK